MDKKSVFFGAGTGIVIVSLVFYGFYSFEHKNRLLEQDIISVMSDEEIIVRAEQLGMIYETDIPKPEPVMIEEPITDEEIINRAVELGMIFPVSNESEEQIPDKQNEYVSITIRGGSKASTIADLLAENDIVEDAQIFTNFLISQDVTTAILSGTFSLPVGGDYDEILSIIKSQGQ